LIGCFEEPGAGLLERIMQRWAMAGGKEVKKIPMTFGDALDALDEDEVVRSALPGDMWRVFRHYKRDEWERYCAEVTDWDVKEYLDVLP
jgi:glutamine synthetase